MKIKFGNKGKYDTVWNHPYIPVNGVEKIHYCTMTTLTPDLLV